MRNHIRRQQIANEVNRVRSMTVGQLAGQFQVSVETVRRDLHWLEMTGRLVRVHGGARTLQQEDLGELFKRRRSEHARAKRIMARKALGLIKREMTIGLDASSSDWFLARLLPDMPLTVVTNSLEVLRELSTRPNVRIICTGGEYCSRHADFVGEAARRCLRGLRIHLGFVSCFGVDLFTGLWESSERNALTKKTMIEVSQETVLLADSSKFGRRSPYNMADWSRVNYVVNDGQLDEAILTRLAAHGVTVI